MPCMANTDLNLLYSQVTRQSPSSTSQHNERGSRIVIRYLDFSKVDVVRPSCFKGLEYRLFSGKSSGEPFHLTLNCGRFTKFRFGEQRTCEFWICFQLVPELLNLDMVNTSS